MVVCRLARYTTVVTLFQSGFRCRINAVPQWFYIVCRLKLPDDILGFVRETFLITGDGSQPGVIPKLMRIKCRKFIEFTLIVIPFYFPVGILFAENIAATFILLTEFLCRFDDTCSGLLRGHRKMREWHDPRIRL